MPSQTSKHPHLLDNLPPSKQLLYSIHSYSSHSSNYVPEHILYDRPKEQKSRWTGVNSFTGPHSQQNYPWSAVNPLTDSNSSKEQDALWSSTNAFNGSNKSKEQKSQWPSASSLTESSTPDPHSYSYASREGSSYSSQKRQFITVQLEHLSIVRQIKMGKFHKPHPCNLREFKVFGGIDPSPSQMNLLFHGGLKNDTVPEIFDLHIVNDDGIILPCKYIRIEPIQAHSHNYNLSIWHVALYGNSDPALLENVNSKFLEFRETNAIKLILKHLRKRKLLHTFNTLKSSTGINLEHPLITAVHEAFVLRGDFDQAEKLLSTAGIEQDLFAYYVSMSIPQPSWQRLDKDESTFSVDGDHPVPRGGHQLAIDPQQQMIYLLGGWDGSNDLSDFWAFDINAMRWRLLSADTRQDSGPGPKSCHKIVLDESTGELYLLGMFVENASEPAPSSSSSSSSQNGGMQSPQSSSPSSSGNCTKDFWKYYTRGERAGMWELLSHDTFAEGGPRMIYDHQMVVDSSAQMIYVFGGKVLPSLGSRPTYSGLYRYDIKERKWALLLEDPSPNEPDPKNVLLSRVGHSMLLDEKLRILHIFAGERKELYLADLWTYNLDTGEIRLVSGDYSTQGGPDAGFTQRATIDSELREWYLLSGLTHQKMAKGDFWIRKIDENTWAKVSDRQSHGLSACEEPMPRYAHQMVYDPIRKEHWLFGGKGKNNSDQLPAKEQRLGDFWRFSLNRITKEDVLRRCKFMVRKQKFIEVCEHSSPTAALSYLQNEIYPIIDHSNEKEAAAYMGCMPHLLTAPQPPPTKNKNDNNITFENHSIEANNTNNNANPNDVIMSETDSWPLRSNVYAQRTEMFEQLLTFFPPLVREPAEDLIDLAQWDMV